ncbi:hypothetical protein ROZALSC1DRAFT_26521 [Rozella allomycis CSF55]|uniref:Uncharacterized protein n=1 Tax=Rozella allomycis (strain CSF55) TaxID=988480 RepID=A0A075B4S7_ROZAC|nr:hypothetical protein O9G_003325 [Rozella allomycis CSF55]RKP22095.1 hypothetical protein ROZALSC1DRAFT_26521 [Rozella allomycis CSF55]|eukprot:EPZ36454.1 hypothetical protein O9G_003325 [Rozella allomycis CSF55]
MIVPVTTFTASFLSLYYVLLSYRVIKKRVQLRIALGDGTAEFLCEQLNSGDYKQGKVEPLKNEKYMSMLKAIRSHGNFNDYVPLILVLMYLVESQDHSSKLFMRFISALIIFGRVVHVELGVRGKMALGRGRVVGMISTLTSIILLSVTAMWHCLA